MDEKIFFKSFFIISLTFLIFISLSGLSAHPGHSNYPPEEVVSDKSPSPSAPPKKTSNQPSKTYSKPSSSGTSSPSKSSPQTTSSNQVSSPDSSSDYNEIITNNSTNNTTNNTSSEIISADDKSNELDLTTILLGFLAIIIIAGVYIYLKRI